MYDLLIKNCLIIDGTGKPGYSGDIAVSGKKIAAIGDLSDAQAACVIDAGGKVVCPGFIDAHGHSDFTLFVNNRGESKIRQGITTEVTGNCGFTAGPITQQRQDDALSYLANTIILAGERRRMWKWKTQNEFLEYSAKDGLSFNIIPLVGQGMIHVGAMGFEDREPTEKELEQMKQMLRAEMEAGFFGMSMAYAYEPAQAVRESEKAALCEVLKEYGGIYTIHMECEGTKLLESVEDAISFARKYGIRVQISHLKARYPANWGKAKKALKMIEAARAEGLEVAFDVYPYIAYGSGLIDLLPPWIKKDGARVMCEQLRKPELRAKALYDMEHGIEGWETIMDGGEWAKCVQIVYLKTEENKCLEGKFIDEIAADRGCTPYEVVADLMVEEDASVKCVWFAMHEDDLQEIMCHPMGMFGTDGRACADYGELSIGAVHPRYYSTYPRIMGHYARDLGIFTLEEAIRKSTCAVAEQFGIKERGVLKEGYFADMVIFDPENIREVGVFGDPHHYPEGIDAVLVNGQVVIDHGNHTGNLPGEILRK